MTQLHGSWIKDASSQAVCRAIADAGHQVFFVGGCVRNELLGAPVADVDIATDAHPDRVITIVEAAGLRAVPTGKDHGTITVVSAGRGFEVTTFRKDVETDGRHAVIAFADSVEEDARRRDFTMNAIYATPEGYVLDPICGIPDLLARKVRFIDDAEVRIKEDYLRILRFFRFHAWYGDSDGGLDADGLAACAAHSAELETLSKERIGAEMRKLLSAPDPSMSLAAMEQTGCLTQVLPGASSEYLPVLVHLEGTSRSAQPMRRLAALGGEEVASHLRLSKRDARDLEAIREAALGEWSVEETGYRLGAALGMDAVLVRSALLKEALPLDAESRVDQGAASIFPIKAMDLPGLAGKALGDRLREMEARWVASGFSLTKDDLIK